MISNDWSIAVERHRVSNPECNAPLTAIHVHTMKHAERRPSLDHVASLPPMTDEVAAINAACQARRRGSRETIERFRKVTLKRVQDQKGQERLRQEDHNNILKANIDQYMETTKAQVARLTACHAAQIELANRSALDKEKEKILGNVRAARAELYSYCKTRAVPQPPIDDDESTMAASAPVVVVTTPKANSAFWARGPIESGKQVVIPVSRSQQASLGATVRKWEMVQERSRVQTEVALTATARSSLMKKLMTVTTEKDLNHLGSGIERLNIPDEDRHKELAPHQRVKRYAEEVRLKNRQTGNPRPKEYHRRTVLERARLAGIVFPPLCSCGLIVSSDRTETASCANNCHFYMNPAAFDRAVDNLLQSVIQK